MTTALTVKVAADFSKAPGPRYPNEGKNSGKEFRENVLYPMLARAIEEGALLIVDLDGAFGYGTSFLEESFGGLIRINEIELAEIESRITIISNEDPELIEEITQYLIDAENERVGRAT